MGTEAAELPLNAREIALLKQMSDKDDLIVRQAQLIEKLAERIARLERDSDDSNQPPSSDPPFKTRKGSGKTGKPGAKPGHKAHQRAAFPPERVDENKIHDFPEGQAPAHLRPIAGDRAWVTFQQITRLKAVVTEHKVRNYLNTQTGKTELAPHPKGLGKLLGPEACAAVAWLKTKGHMAVMPMRDFFRDILDAKIRGGMGSGLELFLTVPQKASSNAFALDDEEKMKIEKEKKFPRPRPRARAGSAVSQTGRGWMHLSKNSDRKRPAGYTSQTCVCQG